MTTEVVTKCLRRMDERRVMVFLYLVALAGTFQQCYSFSNDQLLKHGNVTYQSGSSMILNLSGNVYPKGYYYATINVGNPPRPYFLHIDTRGSVSWLQCDAPCTKCLPAPHPLYKPSKDIVKCDDPFCTWFVGHVVSCNRPQEQCVQEVFTDYASSSGVVVTDLFHLKLINGNTVSPRITFSCVYDQEVVVHGVHPPYTDGVLGLGTRNTTILAQLRKLGLMQNIFSHCFSAQEGGYLVMGDDILPSSGIVWAPMLTSIDSYFYMLGPVEFGFDGQVTGVKYLMVFFDSASTYTYFGSPAYEALLNMLDKTLSQSQLKIAKDDKTLPVCWKGTKAFKSIRDVKNLFKPLVLSFTNSKNVQLKLSPEAYLIVSDRGNVCLGILHDARFGMMSTITIGDISMQDQMVIYDNERQRIGWIPANCSKPPHFS